jgi:hypothetical protein
MPHHLKGETMNEIQTDTALTQVGIVSEPQLVQVKTIKRKYVEQMPRVGDHSNPPPEVEVLGASGAFVVLLEPNGHLIKCHRVDWVAYLMKESSDYKAGLAQAHATLDSYPQLFED